MNVVDCDAKWRKPLEGPSFRSLSWRFYCFCNYHPQWSTATTTTNGSICADYGKEFTIQTDHRNFSLDLRNVRFLCLVRFLWSVWIVKSFPYRRSWKCLNEKTMPYNSCSYVIHSVAAGDNFWEQKPMGSYVWLMVNKLLIGGWTTVVASIVFLYWFNIGGFVLTSVMTEMIQAED